MVGPAPRTRSAIRAALPGDIDVDVAVVGGGFTGLWTAFYLAEADPSLRIAVLERDVVGFGASGRNGGWCSALFAASEERLDAWPRARRRGSPCGGPWRRRSTRSDGWSRPRPSGATSPWAERWCWPGPRSNCDGPATRSPPPGSPGSARTTSGSCRRPRPRPGWGPPTVLGGTYTPHCATIDPARLVRGLAEAVERRGVTIYEQTEATELRPGAVATARGTVRAATVVRATEGYTRTLRGEERILIPVYSLMIATEPLPEEFWATAGLAARETFSDHRHLIIYGQRTADGRTGLRWSGRPLPLRFGHPARSSTGTPACTNRCA